MGEFQGNHYFGLATAYVYSLVWRCCQMHDGICRASLTALSQRLCISRMSLIRQLALLEKEGDILDPRLPYAINPTSWLSRRKSAPTRMGPSQSKIWMPPTYPPSQPWTPKTQTMPPAVPVRLFRLVPRVT